MLESWGRPSRLMVARMPSCRTLMKWRARSRSIIAHKCYSRRPKAPAVLKSAVKLTYFFFDDFFAAFFFPPAFFFAAIPGHLLLSKTLPVGRLDAAAKRA